jgi:hypothetical protein
VRNPPANRDGPATVLVKLQETPRHIAPRRITRMTPRETRGNLVKYVEVLAGAISWGFKSPFPHQILKELRRRTEIGRSPFSSWTLVLDLTWAGAHSRPYWTSPIRSEPFN